MSVPIAELLIRIAGVYAALGVLFAAGFVWRWVGRLDPAARDATTGFRVLIAPGVIALWPYLALRLVAGATAPPDEWTAHRAACRRATPADRRPTPAALRARASEAPR